MLSLSLHTLCDYCKATPSSRNMIEGQNCINSGMIIMCGATLKAPEKIQIYALVLQTSALTSEPHIITGLLLLKHLYEVSIDKMDCSCKAGSSHSCKHIVAVLLYCSRNNLWDLEIVSSTDQKCIWKKHKQPVLEQFEALPTKYFCCIKQNRLPQLSIENLEMIRNRLINCEPESAIAKHRFRNTSVQSLQRVPFKEIQNNLSTVNNTRNTVSAATSAIDYTCAITDNSMKSKVISKINGNLVSLENCCKDLYNKIIACEDVEKIARITKNSVVEWKKERKYRITGSRCYHLYTYSENKDWKEKARKYFWPREFSNKYTMHGNKYESSARDIYAKQTASYVQECGLIVSTNEPWLGYSADGIAIKNDQILKLLEIKCPYELEDTEEKTLLKCKFLCVQKNVLCLKVKHQYYGQIQFGMALLNSQRCDLVIYSSISNTIKIISINFDENFALKMLVNLKEKYFNKMIHQICCQSRVAI